MDSANTTASSSHMLIPSPPKTPNTNQQQQQHRPLSVASSSSIPNRVSEHDTSSSEEEEDDDYDDGGAAQVIAQAVGNLERRPSVQALVVVEKGRLSKATTHSSRATSAAAAPAEPVEPAAAADDDTSNKKKKKKRKKKLPRTAAKGNSDDDDDDSDNDADDSSSSEDDESRQDAHEHARVILSRLSPAVHCWRALFAELVTDLQEKLAAPEPKTWNRTVLPSVRRQHPFAAGRPQLDEAKSRNLRNNALCLNVELFFCTVQHRAAAPLPIAVTNVVMANEEDSICHAIEFAVPTTSIDDPSTQISHTCAAAQSAASLINECNPHVVTTAASLYAFEQHLVGALFTNAASPTTGRSFGALAQRAIQELQTAIFWDHQKCGDHVTLGDIGAFAAHKSAAELQASKYVRVTWCQLFSYLLERVKLARTMVSFKQNTLQGQLALLDRTVDRWRRATSVRLLREWYGYTKKMVGLRQRFRDAFVALSTTATIRRSISRWRHVCRLARDRLEHGDDQNGEGGGEASRQPPISPEGMALATVRALQGQLVSRGSVLDHLSNAVKALSSKAGGQWDAIDAVLEKQRKILERFRNLKDTLFPPPPVDDDAEDGVGVGGGGGGDHETHLRCMGVDAFEDAMRHDLEERTRELQMHQQQQQQQHQQQQQQQPSLSQQHGSLRRSEVSFKAFAEHSHNEHEEDAHSPPQRTFSGIPHAEMSGGGNKLSATAASATATTLSGMLGVTGGGSRSVTPDPFGSEAVEWPKVLSTHPRTSTRISHILIRVRHLISILGIVVSVLQKDLGHIVAPRGYNSSGHDHHHEESSGLFDASINLNASLTASIAGRAVSFAQAQKVMGQQAATSSSSASSPGGAAGSSSSSAAVNERDARSIICTFLQELDMDFNEKVVDELSFIRALLAGINRVAFAGLYTTPSVFAVEAAFPGSPSTTELGGSPSTATAASGAATAAATASGVTGAAAASLQQPTTMEHLFLPPNAWSRAIEFDNVHWITMLKCCLHSLFALSPISIPKLVLLMDVDAQRTASKQQRQQKQQQQQQQQQLQQHPDGSFRFASPTSGGASGASGAAAGTNGAAADGSLGSKDKATQNAQSQRNLKSFRKKAMLAASATASQQAQQRRSSFRFNRSASFSGSSGGAGSIGGGDTRNSLMLVPVLPAISELRKEWEAAGEHCRRHGWAFDSCQRSYEEQARHIVADAFERGQSAQLVATAFNRLVRCAPRLRTSIRMEFLAEKLRLVFGGDDHHHQQQQQQHQHQQSSSHSGGGMMARYPSSASGGGGDHHSASSSSSSAAASAAAGAWRNVLHTRRLIEDAKELEFILHSVSKVMLTDVPAIIEKLEAALDDTDLFFIAMSSHEVHTVLLEHAHELGTIFLLNATKRKAEQQQQQQQQQRKSIAGGPTSPTAKKQQQQQQDEAEDPFAAFENMNGNDNGTVASPTSTTTTMNATSALLLMTQSDFSAFCKPWLDAFLSPQMVNEIFVRTVQRYNEDSRSVTSAQQQSQLLMSQELFPYAVAMVAATKHPNPFLPLKSKVETFICTHCVPLANTLMMRRKSVVAGALVDMTSS